MNNFYIPIDLIRDFLEIDSSNISFGNKELVQELIKEKYSKGKFFKFEGKNIELSVLLNFTKFITGDETIVFDQWIKSSKSISNLLLLNKLNKNDFFNEQKKDHFLLIPFQKFISNFLTEKLMLFLEENSIDTQEKVASYLSILDYDSRYLLTQKISLIFKKEWEIITSKLPETKNENEVIQLIGFYFSEQKIAILNNLSKEFYSLKIDFIDQGMTIFKHKYATGRIAYWLINQLNLVSLNSEHKEKLLEIQESLKKGENTYFIREKKISNKISIKKKVVYSISLLCFFFVLYLIYFLNTKSQDDLKTTSFQFLSKSERIQVDSLILSMENKSKSKDPILEPGNSYLHLTPVSIELKERKEFENIVVERFIQNSLNTEQLITEGEIDSCDIYSNSELTKLKFLDFQKINKNLGDKKMLFKNESSYQVLLILFDNKLHGENYLHILNPKEELKFLAQEKQKFLFIPGNNLGKIIVKKGTKISKNHQHHFCFTDQNFDNQILNSYSLKNLPETTIKIIFNENNSNEFYIVDLSNALQENE